MTNRTDVEVVEFVPDNIKQDPVVISMSEAIQPEIDSISISMPLLQLYANIDLLPEPILRMLAVENRVYRYEWQLATTIESKRELIKNSFELNQRRGTRWSVERVFELLDITANLQEWFEYGGSPYRFRVSIYEINGRPLTENELNTLYRLVNYYKPLRSTLETIDVTVNGDTVNAYSGVAATFGITFDCFARLEYLAADESTFIAVDDSGTRLLI